MSSAQGTTKEAMQCRSIKNASLEEYYREIFGGVCFSLPSTRRALDVFPFLIIFGREHLEKLSGRNERDAAPAHCLSDGECGMTTSVSISRTGC